MILEGKRIYIFGAGKRGLECYKDIKTMRLEIEAFIDNDEKKHGNSYMGKPCIPLKQIIKDEKTFVIVSPLKSDEIVKQLNDDEGVLWALSDDLILSKYHYPIKQEPTDFCNVKPFNFYESPYADMKEIHEEESVIWGERARNVAAIDFNDKRQFQLVEEIKLIPSPEWTADPGEKCRYYYNNPMFGKGSADALYYMLKIINPQRVIEVGSGFSTAAMLDFIDQSGRQMDISCIEPYSERLRSLLRPGDSIRISEKKLQDIPVEFFESLEKDDILFIDSSHVSRVNSDVNYYFYEIFPRLKSGVYIHIHDIPYPMEYYKPWVYEGRAYNELYLLRTFLMYNTSFSIQFFGEYLMDRYPDRLPEKIQKIGGSLWLRKE